MRAPYPSLKVGALHCAAPCSAPCGSIELWVCSACGNDAALLAAVAALVSKLPMLQTLTLTMDRAVLKLMPLLLTTAGARSQRNVTSLVWCRPAGC